MPTLPDNPSLSISGNAHARLLARRAVAGHVLWVVLIAGLLMAGLYLKHTPWNLELMTVGRSTHGLPPEVWMGITVLGTGWVAVLLVSVVDRHSGLCSLAALAALAMGGVLVTSFKHWIPSPRPLRVLGEQSLQVIGQHLTGMNSMPSGHALTAMAAVTVMVLFFRAHARAHAGFAWLLLAPGLLIAWSRVVVGAHWPADVCVGAALGIATGLACWQFSLWCARRWGTVSPKIPILFELLVMCYAPFEKTGYPEVEWLLRVIMALAVISILHRLYRLYRVPGHRARAG